MLNPYPSRFSIPNIATPLTDEIPNGLSAGKSIYVRGTPTVMADRFRIDLVAHDGRVAFHFNPRFKSNLVVRNSRNSQSDSNGWQKEERDGPFLFKKGEQFEALFSIEADHLKVAVNGTHCYDFNYRIPLIDINRIHVSGDFECHEITYVGGLPPRADLVLNPSTPSSVAVVGPVLPGKLFQIIGHVPVGAGRFQVNLQTGSEILPENIQFHFNPRWNDPHTSDPVVIRTHRSGGWATEDRDGGCPFQQGERFELLILCDHDDWKVAVNGNHFISYPHHLSPSATDHISFVDDVTIESVSQFNQAAFSFK